MKRKLCILLAVALLVLPCTNSFAASPESQTAKSNVVAIRENVSHSEAMNDSTYNNQLSENTPVAASAEVYWNVWGEMHYTTAADGTYGAIPIGYSEHIQGDTVLSTYHYTRTYLGRIDKAGDSGRRWGTYTVQATGTFCDLELWRSSTHIVKYGTES